MTIAVACRFINLLSFNWILEELAHDVDAVTALLSEEHSHIPFEMGFFFSFIYANAVEA